MVQSKCELVQMCKCVFVQLCQCAVVQLCQYAVVQLCQCVVVQRKVIKVSEIRDVVAGGGRSANTVIATKSTDTERKHKTLGMSNQSNQDIFSNHLVHL